MLSEAAGRRQHFQARGHSFSLCGPTLSRPITCFFFFFPAVNWLASGFVYATLSLNWHTRRLQTIPKKNLMNEQARNSDARQRSSLLIKHERQCFINI